MLWCLAACATRRFRSHRSHGTPRPLSGDTLYRRPRPARRTVRRHAADAARTDSRRPGRLDAARRSHHRRRSAARPPAAATCAPTPFAGTRRSGSPAKNIICLGLNYIEPREGKRPGARPRGEDSRAPVFFTKSPTSVNGPYDPIPVGSRGDAAGGLRNRAGRRHRRRRQEHPAGAARSITSSATRSSTTCRRAICRTATCSGSRARASTASARWARSSSRPTSSAIRRRRRSRCGSTASRSRTRRRRT